MLNSYLYIKLNEKKVPLTLTFFKINELKNKRYDDYVKFMNILKTSVDDIINRYFIIYISYICANDNIEFDFETFLNDTCKLININELYLICDKLIKPKIKDEFRLPFIRATKNTLNSKKIPDFQLEDVEDYYSYYVLILGISEELFWNSDYSFLLSVVENKVAFDNYVNYLNQQKLKEK